MVAGSVGLAMKSFMPATCEFSGIQPGSVGFDLHRRICSGLFAHIAEQGCMCFNLVAAVSQHRTPALAETGFAAAHIPVPIALSGGAHGQFQLLSRMHRKSSVLIGFRMRSTRVSGSTASRRQTLETGSHTVTVVPLPALLVMFTVPRCNSTISLTMLMPRPVPGILPEVSAR